MMPILIVLAYVLFVVYVLLSIDKLKRVKVIETNNFTSATYEVPYLPKTHVKDSHWFIKTFLRNRKKKG